MEQLPDGKLKYKLKEPITVGTETIGELVIRKPKAKDIRKMKLPPATDDMLNLLGSLCGQAPSVIDELGLADTTELLEVVGNFIQPGPATGSER